MISTKDRPLSEIPHLRNCPRCLWHHDNEMMYTSYKGFYIICPMTKEKAYLSEFPSEEQPE